MSCSLDAAVFMLSDSNPTTYLRSTYCRDYWSVVCFRTVARPRYWRENNIESSILHSGGLRGPEHIPHVSTIVLVWKNYILAFILTFGDLGRVNVNSERKLEVYETVESLTQSPSPSASSHILTFTDMIESYTHSYPYAIGRRVSRACICHVGSCLSAIGLTSASV